eukprot:scaffold2170_cov53-Phaeocystis_antarctica.AAC.1
MKRSSILHAAALSAALWKATKALPLELPSARRRSCSSVTWPKGPKICSSSCSATCLGRLDTKSRSPPPGTWAGMACAQ